MITISLGQLFIFSALFGFVVFLTASVLYVEVFERVKRWVRS